MSQALCQGLEVQREMTTEGSCSCGTNVQAGVDRRDSLWPAQDNDLRLGCQWWDSREYRGEGTTGHRQARSGDANGAGAAVMVQAFRSPGKGGQEGIRGSKLGGCTS